MYFSDNLNHPQVLQDLIDLDIEDPLIEIFNDADIVVDLDNGQIHDDNGNFCKINLLL